MNKKKDTRSNTDDKPENHPKQVRLPGFINDQEVGLGDAIKRVTYAFGIKPCGGCERRVAALNRWGVFSGKRAK